MYIMKFKKHDIRIHTYIDIDFYIYLLYNIIIHATPVLQSKT